MQIKKMKRILTCLVAAALVVSSGGISVYSAGEEDQTEVTAADGTESAGEEEGGETIVIEEEEEEFDSTPDEVRRYLEPAGEMDGYEVYLRGKDYKDAIENDCNARIGTDFADEDEAEDAADEIEKHLKHVELALIDAATGKLAAELEEIGDTDTETIYFSEAGRYLVFLNTDQAKVTKIRYRVSTIDSPYLFLTQDKETLEYYDTDYEELRAELKLAETDSEQCVYRSSDKQWFALLSADQDEAWACVKQVAENDSLKMYVDVDTAIIALENKANGYIWWSTPLRANRDTRATALLVTNLESSAVLTYGDSSSRGTTNLRSRNAAEIKLRETGNGVEVSYAFSKCGITVPIVYELQDGYMTATVTTADIKETKTDDGLVATQLTMLGSFGATSNEESGYFVIPDGCGALINFNNGKTTSKSYSQKVYGRDITMVPTTKPAVTEEVYLPVYGIVRDDGNGMAVVIEEGDGNATLNASVSGQSLCSYNICSYNFQLRGSDTFYMTGDYGNLTVFEDGPIKSERIRVRYYPIAGDDVSYADIADTYRDYLLSDGGVTAKAQPDTTQLYLDLYGGTMKARSILGIPITMRTSMTSYSQAQEIVSGLVNRGVDDMVVVYNNWTNEGIAGKVDNKAAPSGTLGGSSAFNKLTNYLNEHSFDFYPSVDNTAFVNGNGYYSFLHTTIRISNSYSRQMTYNLSYGVQDTSVTTKSLLSPATFTDLYGKLAANYQKKGLSGVSLGAMTSTVWGDYGKKAMSRDDTIAALQTSYQSIHDAELSLLADSCAAYAFPYADRISDVPLQSSGFDVFDQDIPFYQMVMHGLIPYSGTAINASADSTNAFLTTIATGCNPAYDMIYAEASDLKDTALDRYFYSHYAYWSDTAADEYKMAAEILSPVSDQQITDYVRDGDVSVTTYADGTQIEVNYANDTITVGGTVYKIGEGE